jgi:hypothetical protein
VEQLSHTTPPNANGWWRFESQADALKQSLAGAAAGGAMGSLVYVFLGAEGSVATRLASDTAPLDALGSSAALVCGAFSAVCVFLLEYGTLRPAALTSL